MEDWPWRLLSNALAVGMWELGKYLSRHVYWKD